MGLKLIIFILVSVLILAIGIYYFYDPYINCSTKSNKPFILNDTPYSPRDTCFYKSAQEKMDPKICEWVKTEEYMWACIYHLFSKAKDKESFCSKMSEESTKEDCFLLIMYVPNEGDLAICNKMKYPRYKNNCYWLLATLKNDTSICDLMIYKENQTDCSGPIMYSDTNPSSTNPYCVNNFREICHAVVLGDENKLNELRGY
jgi:hypothetical protein